MHDALAARRDAVKSRRCARAKATLCRNINSEGHGLDDPKIDPPTEGLTVAAAKRPRQRGVIGRWVRRLVLIVLALILLPLVLMLAYIPSAVTPVSTLMLADRLAGRDYDRRWVPLEEVSPVLIHSVIMSEDGQFCRHFGIDLGEMRVVVRDALSGEVTRGASTIPMQTVKNLFLSNSRSMLRKAIEIPLALFLDLVMPKHRIVEIYLNIAEWGSGIYGIEAAAQHHFGVPASRLNARQSALLAVTLPNPIARNPAKPSAGLSRLARTIQRRAAASGDYVGCVG
jgi:monofunctional biosynthetic peptidoglycan transglycosylase